MAVVFCLRLYVQMTLSFVVRVVMAHKAPATLVNACCLFAVFAQPLHKIKIGRHAFGKVAYPRGPVIHLGVDVDSEKRKIS